MPINQLSPHGKAREQDLVESLIIESIKFYGQEFFYIPRTLIAVDKVLGEDNLSQFKNSYKIEAYLDNIDNFGGNGSFMAKFGMVIEEQGTITIARRRWTELIGKFGTSILPNRPAEGDLMYFPQNDGLFEIRFVEHQNPFYQLGKLFVYKLKLELFQFNSEVFATNIPAVDNAALSRSFDLNLQAVSTEDNNDVLLENNDLIIQEERIPPNRAFDQTAAFDKEAQDVINFDATNPFADFN